jgi:hypothetical protein
VPSWLAGALAAGGRHASTVGQIPSPWARWENEAPPTRTARSPSQAQPSGEDQVDDGGVVAAFGPGPLPAFGVDRVRGADLAKQLVRAALVKQREQLLPSSQLEQVDQPAGAVAEEHGPLETGEAPPLGAIREVLAKHPADEIILSTAPHRMTRLLAMDLQHRAHRSFGLPVIVFGTTRTES